jgi:hypothetical protein
MWFYWFIFFGPVTIIYLAIIMVTIFYLSMSIKQLINTGFKNPISRKAFLFSLLVCFVVVGVSS